MNGPLVSIGLPAFKAQYFREALESLNNQTYSNFEVLIQDDASPDNLKAILDEVCGGDGRFQYERNEQNSSPNFVRNWNRTVERAKGDFFVLASDDDVYAPTFLETLLNLAGKYPDCNLFYSPIIEFDGKGYERPSSIPPSFESQVEYVYQLIVKQRFTVVPNYLMRLKALRAMGGFIDLPAAWGSDWQTWCRLSANGAVSSREHLFKWRVSGINISTVDSPYWQNEKLKARRMEQPLWREVVQGLNPHDESEKIKIGEIRKKVVDEFESSFVETQMLKDSFLAFSRYMVARAIGGGCTVQYALQRICFWWKFRYRMWKVSRTKR